MLIPTSLPSKSSDPLFETSRRDFLQQIAGLTLVAPLLLRESLAQGVPAQQEAALKNFVRQQVGVAHAALNGTITEAAQVVATFSQSAQRLSQKATITAKEAAAEVARVKGILNTPNLELDKIFTKDTFRYFINARINEFRSIAAPSEPGAIYEDTFSNGLNTLELAGEESLCRLRGIAASADMLSSEAEKHYRSEAETVIGWAIGRHQQLLGTPRYRTIVDGTDETLKLFKGGALREFGAILSQPDKAFDLLSQNPSLFGDARMSALLIKLRSGQFNPAEFNAQAKAISANLNAAFNVPGAKGGVVLPQEVQAFQRGHQQLAAGITALQEMAQRTGNAELAKTIQAVQIAHQVVQFAQLAQSAGMQQAMGMGTMALSSGYVGIAMAGMTLLSDKMGPGQDNGNAAVLEALSQISLQIRQLTNMVREGFLMLGKQQELILDKLDNLEKIVVRGQRDVQLELASIKVLLYDSSKVLEEEAFSNNARSIRTSIAAVQRFCEKYARKEALPDTTWSEAILDNVYYAAMEIARLPTISGQVKTAANTNNVEFFRSQLNRRSSKDAPSYSKFNDSLVGIPSTIGMLPHFANAFLPETDRMPVADDLWNPVVWSAATLAYVDALSVQTLRLDGNVLKVQPTKQCQELFQVGHYLSKKCSKLASTTLIKQSADHYLATTDSFIDECQVQSTVYFGTQREKETPSFTPKLKKDSLLLKAPTVVAKIGDPSKPYTQFLHNDKFHALDWDVLGRAEKLGLVKIKRNDPAPVARLGVIEPGPLAAIGLSFWGSRIDLKFEQNEIFAQLGLPLEWRLKETKISGRFAPFNKEKTPDEFFNSITRSREIERSEKTKNPYHTDAVLIGNERSYLTLFLTLKEVAREFVPGAVPPWQTRDFNRIELSPELTPLIMGSGDSRTFYRFENSVFLSAGTPTSGVDADKSPHNFADILFRLVEEKEKDLWIANQSKKIEDSKKSFEQIKIAATGYKALTAFNSWYRFGNDVEARTLVGADIESSSFATHVLKLLPKGFDAQMWPDLLELGTRYKREQLTKRNADPAVVSSMPPPFDPTNEFYNNLLDVTRRFIDKTYQASPVLLYARKSYFSLDSGLTLDLKSGTLDALSRNVLIEIGKTSSAINSQIEKVGTDLSSATQVRVYGEALKPFAARMWELTKAQVLSPTSDPVRLAEFVPRGDTTSMTQLALKAPTYIPWAELERKFPLDGLYFALLRQWAHRNYEMYFPRTESTAKTKQFCPHVEVALNRLATYMRCHNIPLPNV